MMRITVIGAGIWGVSTAYYLQRMGARVILVDMWGAGNARAGSGGASRIIRLSYGADEIYIDLTARSYDLWDRLFSEGGRNLYHETGGLWLIPQADASYVLDSIPRIEHHGFRMDRLDLEEARRRFPQVSLDGVQHAFFEPRAGILYANQCCKLICDAFVSIGGHYQQGVAEVDEQRIDGSSWLNVNGQPHQADRYVFACGPWNRKLFPSLMSPLTYTSRQEVYYFGVPNDQVTTYSPPRMPTWLFLDEADTLYYGMPFHLQKGFKVAYDNRVDEFDPDTGDRQPTAHHLEAARAFVAQRFPGLAGQPLIESRVCQYENSLDGHFLIDHHPANERVLILGGSSGHGFKMGPAIGEMAARHLVQEHKIPDFFQWRRLEKVQGRTSQFKRG